MGPAFSYLDTTESRRLSHTLSFAFNLAAFSAMLMFVALKTPGKRRHLPALQTWAPFTVLLLASLLILVDLTRHILLDANMYSETLHMFNEDESLTPAGRTGQLTTWIGNALLLVGLIWYVLPAKPCPCYAYDVHVDGL